MSDRNFRKGLLGLLWLIWVGIVLIPLLKLNHSTFLPLLQSLLAFIEATWFWVLALSCGWAFLPWNSSTPPSSSFLRSVASRILLAMGLGAGILATSILVVSFIFPVTKFTYLVFCGSATLVFTPVLIGGLRSLSPHLLLANSLNRSLPRNAGWISLFAICCLQLPAALTPTLYPDTLRYHFGFFRLFEGRPLEYLRDFAESNISSNWQMLYLPQLALFGDACPQLFNWMTLPLIGLAVGLTVSPRGSPIAGLVLVSTPFLLGVSALGNNDLGVAFFVSLTWLALRTPALGRPVIWAGVFSGLALGSKYPAALAVVATAAGVFIFRTPLSSDSALSETPSPLWRRNFHAVLSFAFGVFFGYLPWFLRNSMGSGDPFYPLLGSWLPWADPESIRVHQNYTREMSHYGSSLETPFRWILIPWQATVADARHFESDPGVLLWGFVPLAWLLAAWRRSASFLRAIALTTAIGIAGWTIGPQVTRFFAPLVPLAAVAIGEGWAVSHQLLQKRFLLRAMFLFLLGINLWQTLTSVAGFSDPYRFLLQEGQRKRYWSERSPSFRMGEWLKEHRAHSEACALLGEDEIYFFPQPFRVSGPFNEKWLIQQVKTSMSASDFVRRLKAEKVLWICYNPSRTESLSQRFGYASWSIEERDRFHGYLKDRFQFVHAEGPIQLYRLRDDGSPFD